MPTTMTLRDHARGAVRDEVMRHAWTLFAQQGFEATTVDQIAAAAGMSRRTFFRYFAGKDELVLERLLEAGDRLADALRERPAGEPAWPALRAAFDSIIGVQEVHAAHARPLLLMLRTEPGVRASVLERQRRWQELLTPLVALRLPARDQDRPDQERTDRDPAGQDRSGDDARPDVRAAAVTGSALACLEAAQDAWADHPGTPLAALLDEAMGTPGPGRS